MPILMWMVAMNRHLIMLITMMNDDDQDNFNDDDQAQGAGVQRRLLSLRQVPRQWKFRQVRSWH